MRKPAEQETGAVLGGLNYHNPYDLLNLWQGLTWVEDGNYYHTVDGRFWRLYRIQMAPIDTLNDEAMASISAAVTHVFSEFPEGAMGQFLRITHNDMTPIMERYFDDTGKHEPSHQFADTILDSIMRRQIRGAERGFFDRISSAMLQKAKDETLQEAQEVAFKNSLEEAIDDSVQYGRYAQITELYVTLGWEPPWVTAQNKGALAQAVDAILDGIGLRNVDHTSRQAYEASREDFFTAARRLEQAMRRVGFAPRRVTGQGAVELLFRELNPDRMLQPLPDVTGATPAPLYRPDLTLREQVFQRPDSGRLGKSDLGDSVFLTPVETHPDGWRIDDTHYMPVSLVGTPENVWPGMLYEVMRDFEGAGWVVMNFSRMRNASARLRVQGRAQVVNLKANLQRFPIL